MEWLNYHHLHYFHFVVREGGVAKAARKLRVAHPTVSAQVRMLEEMLGERLFERRGRELVLTEAGRYVARYADDIFSLGRELLDTIHRRPTATSPRLAIGIADPLPKVIARRLLSVFDLHEPPVRLVLRQGGTPALVEELVAHRLDAVLSDAPAPIGPPVFGHLLGECATSFFAAPALATKLRAEFPRSLDGAPFVLPTSASALRRPLEDYFQKRGIHPRVVAEIDDSTLIKIYGQDGAGVFAGPSALADEIARTYDVAVIGEVDSIRERYHLITAQRKIAAPLVGRLLTRGHAMFPARRARREV